MCPQARRGSALTPLLAAAFVLVGCGGRLRGTAAEGANPSDPATDATGDAGGGAGGDGAADAEGPRDGDSASPSQSLDAGQVPVLLGPDGSDFGTPPSDGGLDPNGPCPDSPKTWPCADEGAHLCGAGCSLQCICQDGFAQCHLPPC
jgi:hypothetical protein